MFCAEWPIQLCSGSAGSQSIQMGGVLCYVVILYVYELWAVVFMIGFKSRMDGTQLKHKEETGGDARNIQSSSLL